MISGKVSLSILALLSLLVAAPLHASTCPGVDAVLDQLPEKVPPDFPRIVACENDFQKALAEEIAASIAQAKAKGSATQLAALADLLDRILQRHKEPGARGPRPTAFFSFASELAAHLQRQAPAGATPGDKLAALDGLIAELRQEAQRLSPGGSGGAPGSVAGGAGAIRPGGSARTESSASPPERPPAETEPRGPGAGDEAITAATDPPAARTESSRSEMTETGVPGMGRRPDATATGTKPTQVSETALVGTEGTALSDTDLPTDGDTQPAPTEGEVLQADTAPVPRGWQRMFPFVIGALVLIAIVLSGLLLRGQLIPAELRREKPGRGKPGPPTPVTRSVTWSQEGSGTRATPGAPALLGGWQEPRAQREPDVTPGSTAPLAIVRDGAGEKAAPGTEETGLRQELQRLAERVVHVEAVVALLPYDVASVGTGSSPSPELGAKVSDLAADLKALGGRLRAIEERPPAPPNPGFAAAALLRRIEAVEQSLHGFQEPRPARPNGPAADASPDLDLELAVLRATWERTLKELPFLSSLGEDAGKALREELLCELPRRIEADEELRSSCASVLAPVRELENLIRKVSIAQKLVEGTLPPLDQPARQLQRIREGATLLTMLHSSASFAERLNFRLEQWAGERFLTFADLFLQKRQQALLQGGLPSPAMDDGYRIVLDVLAAADLAPIEIELGRTLFDSSQHVGRSTASQPGLRDGVIAGVVRNGFKQRGGRVVRQPEVVVNRL
jgi:hypothetical protein